MIKILKPDFIHQDKRGKLVQLVHQGYQQVNIISSEKNAIRGNHYHKWNEETFYVIQGKLILKTKKDNDIVENLFETGDMFQIERNIIHQFEFIEDTTLVSLYSNGVELEDGSKDIWVEGIS